MLVFLYGEDSFRSAEKLKKIKEDFFKKNNSNTSSSVFDFREKCLWSDLKTSLKARGLFSSQSLVVIKNIVSSEDKDLKTEAENFFKEADLIDDKEQLIIFWEDKHPKKSEKLFKFLLEKAAAEEFLNLSPRQLEVWIEKKFSVVSMEITKAAKEKIIQYCGNNLTLINQEIDKLISYVGEKKNVSEDDLDNLFNSKIEADIFKTIEMVASKNKKGALEMLHRQLDKGDDPFYILSMYIYQFRNLLKIADLFYAGCPNNVEIARLTKIHPFAVQKGLAQVRHLNLAKLKEVYATLEKIDREAKLGIREVRMGLELLIAKI